MKYLGHHKPRQNSFKDKNELQTAVLQKPTTPTQPLFEVKPTKTATKSTNFRSTTLRITTTEENKKKKEKNKEKYEKENKIEENNVGDGRLLTKEEIHGKKEEKNNNELGFMTEITTKNVLIDKEDQIESSGDILPSVGLNKENLNSTANCSFFPVFVFFTFSILFKQ